MTVKKGLLVSFQIERVRETKGAQHFSIEKFWIQALVIDRQDVFPKTIIEWIPGLVRNELVVVKLAHT